MKLEMRFDFGWIGRTYPELFSAAAFVNNTTVDACVHGVTLRYSTDRGSVKLQPMRCQLVNEDGVETMITWVTLVGIDVDDRSLDFVEDMSYDELRALTVDVLRGCGFEVPGPMPTR